MNVKFKNRITLYYMVAFAFLLAFIFSVIFILVRTNILSNMDEELNVEVEKHAKELEFREGKLYFFNKLEWEEREHTEIQINPIFIELLDSTQDLTDKSPNLKNTILPIYKLKERAYFNGMVHNQRIRLLQYPIFKNAELKGFILAAVSWESERNILFNLGKILIFSYIIILTGLYFFSRYVAGRSILPVQMMAETISNITQNNLTDRLLLPNKKDEIFTLATNFNELLNRLELALNREKQFTSDASHELRTPLASIRGTLEVLIRKPRSNEEYIEKSIFCLSEVDRMSQTINELLVLARMDDSPDFYSLEQGPLDKLVQELIQNYQPLANENAQEILVENGLKETVLVPYNYSKMILENFLSNAIKYGTKGTTISVILAENNGEICCKVHNFGPVIQKEEFGKIFDNYYRIEPLAHKNITGSGLGLAIAKKAAQAINSKIEVSSSEINGTEFNLNFKQILRKT